MVFLFIPCTLRLVTLNKLHEGSVPRTFHLCSWVLECTNTTCYLRFTVCECLVGASCCVSGHSAGNQIRVLSQGPACVWSVFLPTSLTLAWFKKIKSGISLFIQMSYSSDRHLWDGTSLQSWGVRNPAWLPDKLGLLEPQCPAIHDHVP